MLPDQRPGLLEAVAGMDPHEHGPVELRRHRQRVLPAELPGVHQDGKNVRLHRNALVPVQLPVDVPAAGLGILADQQQPPEPGVPGVVKEEAEGPLDQLLQALQADPPVNGGIVPPVEGQGALPEVRLRLPEAEVHDPVKNSPLVLKMIVQRALPDAHRPGDIPDGDPAIPPLGEQLQGRLYDPVLCSHGPPLPYERSLVQPVY